MYRYFYDLHIHSCLSPCGDNDMTPNNIVNMAALKGLGMIAVCDHNTTKNCRFAAKAAKNNRLDIIVVPGVEVTSSEDIHVLVYFPDFEASDAFESEVLGKNRVLIKNNPAIFGEQSILNEFDEKIGEEENLLLNAVGLSVDHIFRAVPDYEAAAVPAHIDRNANGIIGILGGYPEHLKKLPAEIQSQEKISEIVGRYGLTGKILSSSDAHYLWDIHEPGSILESGEKITGPKDFVGFLKKGFK